MGQRLTTTGNTDLEHYDRIAMFFYIANGVREAERRYGLIFF